MVNENTDISNPLQLLNKVYMNPHSIERALKRETKEKLRHLGEQTDISLKARDGDNLLEPNFGISITELVRKKGRRDNSVDSARTAFERGRSVFGRSVMERQDYCQKMTRSDYNILKQQKQLRYNSTLDRA